MKKDVNVYRPKGTKIYYANYRTKVNDPKRGEIVVQRNISTGVTNRFLAQKIGNKKRIDDQQAFAAGTQTRLVTKVQEDFSTTCGQIIDCYLHHSQLTSAKEVVQAFCMMVAEGLGKFNFTVKQREEFVRPLRLLTLSKEQLMAFRDQKARENLGLPVRGANNIHGIMSTGKSIFSRKALEYYGLKLPPNVREWMEVSNPARGKGEDESFQPIDPQKLARMDKVARKDNPQASMMLRLSRGYGRLGGYDAESVRWRNAWAAYWLMRRCGLRNIEVENLRWEWFEVGHKNINLVLINRPYWKPKQTGGRVPIAQDFYAALLEVFGPTRPGPEGYVLEGEARDRYEGANEFVNKFVRRYSPDRAKGAYELRKQYGSEMAAKYDIATAARLLRHKGLEMAYRHYYTPLKDVVPL
jgi:integrase